MNTQTNNKVFIQDSLTHQFYCVECSSNPKGYITSADDEGSPGCNDFAYWSDDINEAYDFGSELSAKAELAMNDLTFDGTRNPVVIF